MEKPRNEEAERGENPLLSRSRKGNEGPQEATVHILGLEGG
jgi:hypothetical protein